MITCDIFKKGVIHLTLLVAFVASGFAYSANGIEKSESVTVYNGKDWVIKRSLNSNFLDVRKKSDDDVNLLSSYYSKDNVLQTYTVDHSGNLYLVLYDAISNVPSGRKLSGVTNSSYVISIDLESKSTSRIVNAIDLGGVDNTVYVSPWGDGIALCASSLCRTITREQGIAKTWIKNGWYYQGESIVDYEIVEVSFDPIDKLAAAVVRKPYDSRFDGDITEEYSAYYVVEFDENSATKTKVYQSDVPWGLRFVEGNLTYSRLSETEDHLDVFYYDLNRLGWGKKTNLAVNNLEGRIAWSQLYELNGLLNAILINGLDRKLVVEQLRERVGYLLNLCNTEYPKFKVKRYSVEREPIDIALHLSRINHFLLRYEVIADAENDTRLTQCILENNKTLEHYDNTLEGVFSTKFGTKEILYPQFKTGYPFWADGINVPFNFSSAIADYGLASSLAGNYSDKYRQFLLPILEEIRTTSEDSTAWRYWWGRGQTGWNDNDKLSLNTPTYPGYGDGLAHITYMTIDALAILSLHKVFALPPEILSVIEIYAKKGRLLPSINERLSDEDKIFIDDIPALRYSRSAFIWELQGQPFALNNKNRKN